MSNILNYDKPRNWRGTTATSKNYIYCYDPNERSAKPEVGTTKRRGRPPTTYNYIIKIVHDPLEIGGFRPGAEFSVLEKNKMLQYGGFTIGTSLIVQGVLNYIHSDGASQVIKKWKPSERDRRIL